MRLLFLICFLLCLTKAHAAEAPANCESLLAQEMVILPNTTLEVFDRTPDKGWRVLEAAKCYAQAEEIITRYLVNHEWQSSLHLHLGQLQLRQEKRPNAATSFRNALRKGDGATGPFKFNEFALALAAFAEHDRIAFDKNVAVVSAGTENFGNRQNMRLLKALAENFDAKYVEILAVLEKSSTSK